ncbi:hypothetical protein E8E14_003987 [Neopestalotiopsis sp. 37M]|nr:hypothetical protein E8E14_003987 [Neopestalotiopsis sp. 37M]
MITNSFQAFIMACLASFRALFAQKERKALEARREAAVAKTMLKPVGLRARARLFHDTLLNTCITLELGEGSGRSPLPMPVSGRLSIELPEPEDASSSSRFEDI